MKAVYIVFMAFFSWLFGYLLYLMSMILGRSVLLNTAVIFFAVLASFTVCRVGPYFGNMDEDLEFDHDHGDD